MKYNLKGDISLQNLDCCLWVCRWSPRPEANAVCGTVWEPLFYIVFFSKMDYECILVLHQFSTPAKAFVHGYIICNKL